MTRFKGKVAIVTGGASGIGLATARQLAFEGAHVVIGDVARDAGAAAAASIGDRASYSYLDVASEEAWIAVVSDTVARFGRLDYLVNCAGAGGGVPVDEESLEHWNQVLSTNATGAFLGCKHAIPRMREAGGGAIVNIASAAGTKPLPQLPAYCAAKAAMLHLTRCVALHCAQQNYNIRCNSIQPGITDTPRLQWPETEPGGREAMLRKVVAQYQPMGRALQAEEIAASVLFLLSDEASMITGATLAVDGGFSL